MQKSKAMTAEEFYKLYKRGKKMENEYFIALDKETLFEMMEAYAKMKSNGNHSNGFDKNNKKQSTYKAVEHN